MQRAYMASTRVLSALLLVLGLTVVAIAIAGGGGPLARGVVIGAMLAFIGGARLWLSRAVRADGGER